MFKNWPILEGEKGKEVSVCNLCWFPWYKYSLHDQCQATPIPENVTIDSDKPEQASSNTLGGQKCF